MYNKLITLFLFLILLPLHLTLPQENSPYHLISSGGQKSANSSFIINSSIGETLTGKSLNSNNYLNAGFWSIYQADIIVSVEDNQNAPLEFNLGQNYPNPFNPNTTIQFSLPRKTQLRINLYNILGEKVKTITEGLYEAGNHKVTLNVGSLSSGTYIYRLESSEFKAVKKFMLLK